MKKMKQFFTDVGGMAKLRPLMFVGILISLAYGVVITVAGSVQTSFFIGISGICAILFGAAKFYGLKTYAGLQRTDNDDGARRTENVCTKNMAISASVMSFLHVSIAIVCLLFQEESPDNYGLWFIWFVGVVTLVKIVLGAVNAIRTRKNHSVIIHEIKLTDLANALISIGLLQRSILYFVGDAAARTASGIGGIVFGAFALIVCLTMFLRYRKRTADAQKDSEERS